MGIQQGTQSASGARAALLEKTGHAAHRLIVDKKREQFFALLGRSCGR